MVTFPVVRSWGSKHHIVVVLGEGGRQALLTCPEPFVASWSALAEFPATTIFIRSQVDGQVLTEDVTSPNDVVRLLAGVHRQALLIAMSTCLKLQNATVFKLID